MNSTTALERIAAQAAQSSGKPVNRVDGKKKVTGEARYAGEFFADGMTYGFALPSRIASGRIVSIEAARALELPGVLMVLTHENRPEMPLLDDAYKDQSAPGGMPFRPLWDDRVWYSGQPVALVVAESHELARHAASLIEVTYERTPHCTDFREAEVNAYVPSTEKGGFEPPPPPRGDADAALNAAPVKIDQRYSTPPNITIPWSCMAAPSFPSRPASSRSTRKRRACSTRKST